MAQIVMRVRLVSGDQLDVTYEEPDTAEEEAVLQHAVQLLSEDSGVLRSRHGGRLLVLFGRGVSAFELAPRGAVL